MENKTRPELYIKVETRHFKRSNGYFDNYNCPLAEALKEGYPNAKVVVFGFTVEIDGLEWCIKAFDGDEHSSWGWGWVKPSAVDDLIEEAKAGKEIATHNVVLYREN